VPKINANTRDFEAELEAQQEQNLQPQAELHPDTEVVTATAL